MITQRLTQLDIDQAAAILKNGGLVGIPTETVLIAAEKCGSRPGPVLCRKSIMRIFAVRCTDGFFAA